MKHVEVEQKYQLLNHDELRQRLKENGGKRVGVERQIDVYYNAPHRDFLASDDLSEWLRLRDEHGRVSINYKHWWPAGVEIKTHCDEYEADVSDGDAMRKLLAALDFKELITVDKEREKWDLGDIEIALDTVKDLGTFVEFEYKGDEAQTVDEAHEQIKKCITMLGAQLGPAHGGYPHKLIALQKTKASKRRL